MNRLTLRLTQSWLCSAFFSTQKPMLQHRQQHPISAVTQTSLQRLSQNGRHTSLPIQIQAAKILPKDGPMISLLLSMRADPAIILVKQSQRISSEPTSLSMFMFQPLVQTEQNKQKFPPYICRIRISVVKVKSFIIKLIN